MSFILGLKNFPSILHPCPQEHLGSWDKEYLILLNTGEEHINGDTTVIGDKMRINSDNNVVKDRIVIKDHDSEMKKKDLNSLKVLLLVLKKENKKRKIIWRLQKLKLKWLK